MLAPVVPLLVLALAPSDLHLTQPPRSKRFTLWFRRGAKRVFYISVVRKTGRCVVEMGGLDPSDVLRAIGICREHFDNWFQITHEDIQSGSTR